MHHAQGHRTLALALLVVVVAASTAFSKSAHAEGTPRLVIAQQDPAKPSKPPKRLKRDLGTTLYIREVSVPLRRAPSPDAEITGWLTLNDGCSRQAEQNGFWRLRCTFASRPGDRRRGGRRMVEGWGDPAQFTEERIGLADVERAFQKIKLPGPVDLPVQSTVDELAKLTKRILEPREERARLLSLRCALRDWDSAACAEALDELAALEDFAQRDRSTVGPTPIAGRCTWPEPGASASRAALVACLEKEAKACLRDCEKSGAAPARGYLATAKQAFVLFVAEPGGRVRVLAREKQGDVVFETDRTEQSAPGLHRLVWSAAGRSGAIRSRWAHEQTSPRDSRALRSKYGAPSTGSAADGEPPVQLQPLPAHLPMGSTARVLCSDRIAPRGRLIGKVATTHWADAESLLWRYVYETPCSEGRQFLVAREAAELVEGPFAPTSPVRCEDLFSSQERRGENWSCSVSISGDMNGDGRADAVVEFADAGLVGVGLWLSGPDGLTRRVLTLWNN